ncbi:MAG: acetate/propionate family kinase [Bacillota bacterium]
MNILVINCGSSSLKYQLINMENEEVLAKGLAERIGIEKSVLIHCVPDKDKVCIQKDMKNHTEAIRMVLDALIDKEHGVIKSMDEIKAVGHRVVHGGEDFAGSVVINDDVMKALENNASLAPLHNPANIMGIDACRQIMPDVPMVGVFDTAFHQTMPKEAYLYALPYSYYSDYKVRRYGFHGTSHKYVSQRVAELMGKPYSSIKTVTCHLGNGSSIAAVDCGKSVDTSMGLTPLEGVPMGTRCGDIDPSIIEYMMREAGMSAAEIMNDLNKKSGVFGISGVSSDFRDLFEAAKTGNDRAQAALDIFCYRIRKYIGAYVAAMNGVDAIVFTAGIGENAANVRAAIVAKLGYLGVTLDKEKNNLRGQEVCISTPDSKVQVWVVPTNEELVIARDTLAITNGKA